MRDKKLLTIAELGSTLQKMWNELPQKPVAKAVQNFRKRLQAFVNKTGEHFEDFVWHSQGDTPLQWSVIEQLFK